MPLWQTSLRRRTFLHGVPIAMMGPMADGPALAASSAHTTVQLVGASIGQGWKLAEFPRRAGLEHYSFEAVQVWQFDKSEAIAAALARPHRVFKPTWGYVKGFFQPPPAPVDVVIIKECSSYFPSDARAGQAMIARWTEQVRAAGKKVWLATVVPVTHARSQRDAGKQESLVAYNEWVRRYAKRESIPLLDLEAAMRTDDRRRYLREEFDVGDGSHLNERAYAVLDRALMSIVCDAAGNKSCVDGGPLAR